MASGNGHCKTLKSEVNLSEQDRYELERTAPDRIVPWFSKMQMVAEISIVMKLKNSSLFPGILLIQDELLLSISSATLSFKIPEESIFIICSATSSMESLFLSWNHR